MHQLITRFRLKTLENICEYREYVVVFKFDNITVYGLIKLNVIIERIVKRILPKQRR